MIKGDLSNKITKFYASNQGEVHLTDSDNGKIQDMMLYGQSEQNQYRGNNLLPTTMYSDSKVINGVTFINNGDGSVTVSGTATDIAYFTLWGYNVIGDKGVLQGIAPGDVLYVSDCLLQQTNSKTIVSSASNMSTQFYDSTTTMYVAIKINQGESVNKTFYPQIEKGSVATSYEPYTGGQPSPSPDYPQEIKSVVNPTVNVSNEDGTKSQTVTLPYTLNAIPVSSGGNITIDDKQYVSDYVDVERGKLVRMIIQKKLKELNWNNVTRYQKRLNESNGYMSFRSKDVIEYLGAKSAILCKNYIFVKAGWNSPTTLITYADGLVVNDIYSNFGLENWSTDTQISSNIFGDTTFFAELATPQEIDLTLDQIQAFKSLATNYPVTNIEVSSDQLDGYTVFNYPINMANGWNYVKQQLNDNRDYIYDMDLQSAESYVNSEYAVALTELEV